MSGRPPDETNGVGPPVAERPGESQRLRAHGLLLEKASLEAVKVLRGAGLRPILLKGPLQQWWLEPGGSPRPSIDVDLLVSRREFGPSEAALRSAGFERVVALPDDVGREHSSVWVGSGLFPVELHWSLVGVDANRIWDVVSREAEGVTLAGETVEIPNAPARCMIIGLHAAQHGLGEPAIFGDLEKALVTADLAVWRRASQLAREAGGWVPFAGALSLLPRGSKLLADLGESAPALDERQALSLLTPKPTSRGFYLLGRERGVGAKARFLVTKLLPPAQFMRLRYPLARRGGVGLALAYLYRPLWLLRWTLPGLRAWRRAQRLSRSNEPGPGRSSARG